MRSRPSHPRTPEQVSTRRNAARRVLHRLAAIVAAACVGLVPAAQAQAAPTPEEIDAQIEKKWEELEGVIEQYNKVRVDLKANQKKAAELEKKIQPLSLQVDEALSRVGGLAVRFYKSGPSSNLNALLTTGNPTTLADQLTYLNLLNEHERRQIADVVTIRDKYNAEKTRLDNLIAQGARQEAELAGKKKEIDAEVTKLKAMMPKTVVKVANCPTINGVVTSAARIAIETACAQVGDPYVWGATGPNSFDCSGLTQYAFGKAGIYLPHYTGDQITMGRGVTRAEARPGDLVFFPSHVGLYIGNGLMVHAPTVGQNVTVASVGSFGKSVTAYRRIG
ncbi:C40 family peptidase [Micromonospora sp. NPDC003197]